VGDIRFDTMRHGGAGYASAKRGVVGLVRYYANSMGQRNIRANTVNPTGVRTPMVVNEQFAERTPILASARRCRICFPVR